MPQKYNVESWLGETFTLPFSVKKTLVGVLRAAGFKTITATNQAKAKQVAETWLKQDKNIQTPRFATVVGVNDLCPRCNSPMVQVRLAVGKETVVHCSNPRCRVTAHIAPEKGIE